MGRSGTSIQKREKEKARVQNRMEKDVRKAEARDRRSLGRPGGDGEDPDLAGIIPGPQPLPEEFTAGEDKSNRTDPVR